MIMKTSLWSSLGRICKRWSLAESSQVHFLRTLSSLDETRYSDGVAKFGLHRSTTGFVLQGPPYDFIICSIQGNLCSSGADAVGLLSQAFTALGWVCFVLFGGRYVIPALASSASVQGACVSCVHANWMCSSNGKQHPKGAPHSILLHLMWPIVYGAVRGVGLGAVSAASELCTPYKFPMVTRDCRGDLSLPSTSLVSGYKVFITAPRPLHSNTWKLVSFLISLRIFKPG